jgi:hypothetical protein
MNEAIERENVSMEREKSNCCLETIAQFFRYNTSFDDCPTVLSFTRVSYLCLLLNCLTLIQII